MSSIQFECCPSTTVTLGHIKINLIILSLYLTTVFQSFRAGEKAGFALPIAIVAKCEEIINLAQKILIWRQLLAKEKSQVKFCLATEHHLRLQVIASCCLMVINVYLNCQLTPQLSTTQFSS